MILGNLGQDPELRYTQSGTAVCTLSVATTDKRKDQDGNYQEQTEWHRVNVWKNIAENCAKYLKKGSKVYAEGKLSTRKWEDKNGVERYTTEITAFTVEFLDPKGSNDSQGQAQAPGGDPSLDDIPF